TLLLHATALRELRTMNRLTVVVLGLSLFTSCALAQAQPQQNSSSQAAPSADQAVPPTVHATAQEVVLDMVFRDKKGKAIRDVRPEEIHISEDGVEQKLTSFHLVQGTAAPTGAGQSTLQLDPMREVRLVTLVFEGLDQEGKRFFRQAVKDILDM